MGAAARLRRRVIPFPAAVYRCEKRGGRGGSFSLSLSLSLSPSGRPSPVASLQRDSLVEIPRDFREREEERRESLVHSRLVSIIGKSAGVRARRLADVEWRRDI